MQPEILLDADALRDNAHAWRERAGAALRVVIKSQGYGWGFETLVDALDDVVTGYYVSDEDEFEDVRPLTQQPLITLVDVRPQAIARVLDCGGIPTVSTAAGIDAAEQWARGQSKRARVRLALRGAIGWSGISPGELGATAALLAGRDIDLELSSHITDPSRQAEQMLDFESALSALRAAGVSVVATDLANTQALASNVARYTHVRLGVGLFGARYGSNIDVTSAVALRAPVVEVLEARGQFVGYGTGRAPEEGYLAVVRCGYSDGFPRVRDATGGVLAVGMQFTTLHRSEVPSGTVDLIEGGTDLDALAASGGISVHELVVNLGAAYRLARRGGR